MKLNRRSFLLVPIATAIVALYGCGGGAYNSTLTTTQQLQSNIDTIVVIYAENRAFDTLYGKFPGADGIDNALKNPSLYTQLDRDGSVLPYLPAVWNAAGATSAWSWVAGLPNKPFEITGAKLGVADPLTVNGPDLVHRFYNNQMQINGGRNNKFAAWSDAGGLSMGYYDGSSMQMWKIAQQYTLADKFFQGAFGGSYLNHQYLVCACAPVWTQDSYFPNSQVSALTPNTFDSHTLAVAPSSPPSALSGKPVYVHDSKMTPLSNDGKYYSVNTSQPSFQPSRTAPSAGSMPGTTDYLLAAPNGNGSAGSVPIPALTNETIGDRLTAKGISWKWYAGAWNDALANYNTIYNAPYQFQPHHQPFNYYDRFTPKTAKGRAERTEHLKDYVDLVADAKAGKLPQVVFFKPAGINSQHAGYANIRDGDTQIADVIKQLQASPQWGKMAIIVTYDENGGFFDHVAPPTGDYWGPGTRIPAIIISPFAKKGYVDHTEYDIGSIHQFISRRFGLELLAGVRKQFGDLTNAFSF